MFNIGNFTEFDTPSDTTSTGTIETLEATCLLVLHTGEETRITFHQTIVDHGTITERLIDQGRGHQQQKRAHRRTVELTTHTNVVMVEGHILTCMLKITQVHQIRHSMMVVDTLELFRLLSNQTCG